MRILRVEHVHAVFQFRARAQPRDQAVAGKPTANE